MIVSNNQENILYFKEYPCYSITTHLSEHKELQFANVTLVQFSHQTKPKSNLPKFCIDKYQSPQQMYWFEWRMQEIDINIINEARERTCNTNSENQQIGGKVINTSTESLRKKKYRCLYIAELGRTAHIKLVFNYDPQIVAICQDYIYTIGANQLIITQLWPLPNLQTKDLDSSKQLPPKKAQIVHQLDSQSKVLSLDFVCDQQQNMVSKVIYFNDKKGIYSLLYKKDQLSESSLMNKLIDFSLKFKKSHTQPLHYQTLVDNILGIVIHNSHQFSLFNIIEMKTIPNTRMTLQGWQLNHHQEILVKTYQNKAHEHFNDCLTISIGQGANVEIFLYHIRYSDKAMVYLPKQQVSKVAYQLSNWPVYMFSSGEFIDFELSILKHFTLIHLEGVSYLTNMILEKKGLLYLGYNKDKIDSMSSDQLPISGYVKYNNPYVSHEILMQENKIWREYKWDVLLGLNEDSSKKVSETLQRLLAPGRYDIAFLLKTLGLRKISQLINLLQSKSIEQINKKLLFEWRNEYKFVEFVIYREEFLTIRKNSIGTLVEISQQQYSQEKDQLSEIQVSYDQLQSRGFSAQYDVEGDRLLDGESPFERMAGDKSRGGQNILFRSQRCYEQKMRTISAKIRNQREEFVDDSCVEREEKLPVMGYYDQEENNKYCLLYQQALTKVISLAKSNILSLPERSVNIIDESTLANHQQQESILLHVSILSLRVKDQLSFIIDSLKTNYPYFFEFLYQRKSSTDKQKKMQNEQLEKVHLQHVYTVFVLEWIDNVAGKYCLQEQYEMFEHDLLQQFVNQYVIRHFKGAFVEQNGTLLTSNNYLFKADLGLHVDNVLTLLFRGLLKQIDSLEDTPITMQAVEIEELTEQEIVALKMNSINSEGNPFLTSLLKRHSEIKWTNGFITERLLSMLYGPLIVEPFNADVSSLVPVNKTFVYSILSLPISKQQKMRIISSHMDKPSFLAILLLIQLQNNCYLLIDEGLQILLYDNDLELFYRHAVRLSRESCCILEEVILNNYKAFLFPDQQAEKLGQGVRTSQIRSQISNSEHQQHKALFNKKSSIIFVKNLFSNIDFMYLTAIITRTQSVQQNEPLSQNTSYQNKSIGSFYRQLIQQVQKINENYGPNRGTVIERTFKKFFNKIYHPKVKKQLSPNPNSYEYEATKPQSQIYPQMTGEGNLIVIKGYNLSREELYVIEKLYTKHNKILKLDKKWGFESTSLIQQRLNLEYSMIKIYLFRLNLALKQIPTLTAGDKVNYVDIMKECVFRLKEATSSFKFWRAKLSDQQSDISDDQFLQVLIQIDQMENSQLWLHQNEQETQSDQYQNDQSYAKWQILGVPLSSEWLQLLQLTFTEANLYERPTRPYPETIFTNYQSLDSILMKILIVIKNQRLLKEYQFLNKLFGHQKVQQVIQGNELLRNLYPQGQIQFNQQNIFQRYRQPSNVELFSQKSINQLNYHDQTGRNILH